MIETSDRQPMVTPPEDRRWYHGQFYDRFIAPHQDVIFEGVREIVGEQARILDVGCGTGRLAFQLAGRSRHIDGVDVSSKNIRVARNLLAENPRDNVAFHHSDIQEYVKSSTGRYDYAVLTYVTHELLEHERVPILDAVSSVVHKIVIVDYLVPQPRNVGRMMDELIEYLAGRENYRNYRSYIRSGGLSALARLSGLSTIREVRNQPPGTHMLVLAGRAVSPGDACW